MEILCLVCSAMMEYCMPALCQGVSSNTHFVKNPAIRGSVADCK